jgi:hypothetical protein
MKAFDRYGFALLPGQTVDYQGEGYTVISIWFDSEGRSVSLLSRGTGEVVRALSREVTATVVIEHGQRLVHRRTWYENCEGNEWAEAPVRTCALSECEERFLAWRPNHLYCCGAHRMRAEGRRYRAMVRERERAA